MDNSRDNNYNNFPQFSLSLDIKWERRSSAGDIGGQFPGGEMDTSNPIRNGRLATGLRVIFIEAAIHPHFATPSVARLSSE